MEKEFSENQILNQLNTVFAQTDQNRNDSLEQFSSVQQVQVALLQSERDRLLNKYGERHPRVQRSEAKLAIATGLSREFQTEAAKAKVDVPPYSRRTWRIHGRVLNPERQGLEGLTLSLFDENKRWIRAIGVACSNEQGYFSIDYPAQRSAASSVPPTQPLVLTVTDTDRQILHQESSPLFAKVGVINYREIVLDGNSKVVVTPDPDASNPPTDRPSKPTPPSIEDIAARPATPRVGMAVQFRASVKGDGPLKYSWSFGDGERASDDRVSHIYNRPGNYVLKLEVANIAGVDSRELKLSVSEFTPDESVSHDENQ